MEKHRAELNELKLLYQEILQGCSFVESVGAYIKHSSERENVQVLKHKLILRKKYISEGLPTEEESLARILEDGTWTKADDENILQLKYIIADNEKEVVKIIPAQQKMIRDIIASKKQELAQLLWKKKQLLNMTVEDAVEEDIMNYIAYLHTFQDEAMQVPIVPTLEQFEELDTDTLAKYVEASNLSIERFPEEAMRKISICPFFLNAFSHCKENLGSFLNKPIAFLTYNQMALFSMGGRNLSIILHSEVEPPNIYLEDVKPQDVVNWFDAQYSVLMGKKTGRKK